jgi:2-polyprenyl-3-methyl-5-hydroxy-6-metoxy-1,4-benzoquinol methylase
VPNPNFPEFFKEAYDKNDAPWDSGKPEPELIRLIDAGKLPGKSLLEFGCGTGTNAIELARRGYAVTAVDYIPKALEQACDKAVKANVKIDFRQADLLSNPKLGGPYDVIFDRGVYHSVRTENMPAFRKTLESVTRPGTLWLCLAGNAKEQTQYGPPRVHEQEFRTELEPLFEIIELREIPLETNKPDFRPLFWSILMKRK